MFASLLWGGGDNCPVTCPSYVSDELRKPAANPLNCDEFVTLEFPVWLCVTTPPGGIGLDVGNTVVFVVDFVTLGVSVAHAAMPLIRIAIPCRGVQIRA